MNLILWTLVQLGINLWFCLKALAPETPDCFPILVFSSFNPLFLYSIQRCNALISYLEANVQHDRLAHSLRS